MPKDRPTILFGNGLGMAADPTFYCLDRALQAAWNFTGDGSLSDDDKHRVMNFLPRTGIDSPPIGEAELRRLQEVISACDTLNGAVIPDHSWLTPEAENFPRAVRRYFGLTTSLLHVGDNVLPESFTEPLKTFIQHQKPHVATLNYDDLLYYPFTTGEICKGYDGNLVDGFHSDGFSPENLDPLYGRGFGWYLHLHGSPLFYEGDDGSIKKMPLHDLSISNDRRKHIVLSHHDYKLPILISSPVLSEYWRRFTHALNTCSHLVVYGYSGLDRHVNKLIRDSLPQASPVSVVEWSNAGEMPDRRNFWSTELGREVWLHRLNNVLTFDFMTVDWQNPIQQPPLNTLTHTC